MIRSDKGVFWAILLPLIAVLIWSLNIAVTRYVAEYISPVSISFYRWLIAFLILTPWILPKVWQQRELIRPHLKQLAVLSAFGLVLYQGLSYTAANYTTATNMGIINAFIPMFTVLVSLLICGFGLHYFIFGFVVCDCTRRFASTQSADRTCGRYAHGFGGIFLRLLWGVFKEMEFKIAAHAESLCANYIRLTLPSAIYFVVRLGSFK